MQNSKKIQWFPGHMTKAARQMEENLKKVDFVIEIRDARIPDSSRNPMLDGIIHTKPRLIILSKKDKADPKLTKEWITYLEKDNVRVIALDLVHENYKAAIVQASKTLCASFIEKQKRRGIKPRALRAMVCGIPNVGKSTMINTLAKRKAAKTADKPGVTKSLQWIKLDKDLELLDTPGVLWPKFDDQQIGLKLALLGSIRDEVVTMDELAMFAVEWLMENNPSSLIETYGIKIQDTPWHTLEQVAIKRGYLQKGQIDENRLMNSFVKDMRENKCGLITWEKPNVG
ncbi:ribosome biogenesis GTPase YlqF [Faecalitalea cylindroides]|uniref:Ribosome biogenesis GTPase A n=1 Tax=Faecalitalea cylindroides TaxID=39483 RepID=A0AAW6FTY7_9FIRM|nr:ribosome biogenesis GTPase YlqF [Faecalitalea cylindroides]MDC0829246.1 ribosome biogenesis GTPase YlqF [Faecalitalea cylindroides]